MTMSSLILSIKQISQLIGLMMLTVSVPSKHLWPYWEAHQANSVKMINHQLFQQFLTKYVYTSISGVNLVHYSQVTTQDKLQLEAYLDQLAHVPINQYNRDEQLAYWINLYNALTIDMILKNYPVKSILDIKLGGWFTRGPWDAQLTQVDSIPLSLNDIEHRIIRPIWNDPLTHYALNCASYGCPNLQKQVYSGKTVNRMLIQAAKEYINSPQGVLINDNKLIVSQIYDWYQVDFGGSEQEVIQHLSQYAKPMLKQQLTQFRWISDYHYDWRLNGN